MTAEGKTDALKDLRSEFEAAQERLAGLEEEAQNTEARKREAALSGDTAGIMEAQAREGALPYLIALAREAALVAELEHWPLAREEAEREAKASARGLEAARAEHARADGRLRALRNDPRGRNHTPPAQIEATARAFGAAREEHQGAAARARAAREGGGRAQPPAGPRARGAPGGAPRPPGEGGRQRGAVDQPSPSSSFFARAIKA